MDASDFEKLLGDAADMFVDDDGKAELMTQLGLIKGDVGLIRERASAMLPVLLFTNNSALSANIVLRLGELLTADATQLGWLDAIKGFAENSLARFCHILGYSGKNGLKYGDDVKKLASHESPLVRKRAIQALRRMAREGLQGTNEVIRQAMNDPDEDVRDEAIRSLE